MPAANMPYSIALTPFSFARKLQSKLPMTLLLSPVEVALMQKDMLECTRVLRGPYNYVCG
jgi:hypothetical protein